MSSGGVVWVRAGGVWRRAGLDDPPGGTLATLDELLAALGTEMRPADRAHGTTSPIPVGETWVRPAWKFVGAVQDGALLVETPDAAVVRLDRRHIEVLDALDGPQQVGMDEALTSLAKWGLVEVVPPPHEVMSPAEPSSGPADPGAVPSGHQDAGASGLARPPGTDGRIPVYAVWHADIGPMLSLGMLTAAARAHRGGALEELYEIRVPEEAGSFLDDLASRSGPAVLLCSDYVWSVEANLEVARRALLINPDLVVIHGGPSCPKYEPDIEAFLDEHGPVAHVLVHGEGEYALSEVLDRLAAGLPDIDHPALADVAGLSFRVDGATVHTAPRDRIADLDALPSPYLTGEFDHIPPEAWTVILSVESNRGCPYGCTYCDWGSSTLSRIRKFDLDRVVKELEWAASRGIGVINMTDANFGIMSRDVELAENVAEIRQRTGFPHEFVFYPAKNTTKYLVKITDVLTAAGVGVTGALSLQSTDPDTLDAIDRSNISTDHYVQLAAEYRRRHFPLLGDVLLGLPGQTYDSYRRDLQFHFDHEIMARTWRLKLLPNAPINEPGYRARHDIRSDRNGIVMSTSTFSPEDRERMLRLRDAEIIFERLGVLRHVLRWLQWDHDLEATRVIAEMLDDVADAPDQWPLLAWVLRHFEQHSTAPIGWASFYDEVRRYLMRRVDLPDTSGLDCVIAVQVALMPQRSRTFPSVTPLAHDYVSYYRQATDELYRSGRPGRPERRLEDMAPGSLTVLGDPLGLCSDGLSFTEFLPGKDVEEMEGDFTIGGRYANELDSVLVRRLPAVGRIVLESEDIRSEVIAAPAQRSFVAAETPLRRRRSVRVSLRRRN